MDALRVCLFGRFDVCYRRQILSGFEARKVQDLFCYLLLCRQRPHSREALADLLWSEQATTRSRRYLRKVLWQLQAALDAQVGTLENPLLLVEFDWVQINPKANVWLDVAVFEQAFTLVRGIQGRLLDSQCVQKLQGAVDLYRGDLLEGCYQDWCIYERERFQYMYLAMLDKLMDHCQANHDYEAGLSYGRRILRYDRARERTHRRLMRLYYLAGDRTAALRHYERCVAALEEDLGVKPTRSTMALYEQIRADRLDVLPVAATEIGSVSATIDQSLVAALDRLKQLHVVLVDVQCCLQQEIQSVELALEDQQ